MTKAEIEEMRERCDIAALRTKNAAIIVLNELFTMLKALEESEAPHERSESSHALKNARIADLEAERDRYKARCEELEQALSASHFMFVGDTTKAQEVTE